MEQIILSHYNKYTKSEHKIADYVLNHNITYQSIVELAKEIGVGEATILRFCKKIGFTGFYDFKISYIKSRTDETSSDEVNVIETVYNIYLENISLAKQRIDLLSIKEASRFIKEAKDIIIFGVGNSGITAKQFEAAMQRRAYVARSIEDPHFQSIVAATLSSNSLVFAISLSGYTKDIIDSVTIAKNSGAKVIAVTSFSDSLLGQLADVCILTSSKENPLEGGALSAKISQLFVLDVLIHQLDGIEKDTVKEIKEKTAKAISRKIVY